MSDLDLTKNTNFSQNQNTGSSQNLKDQVVDAGAEMKQRAGDALRASTDMARDKFKEAADAAKDVASGTADQTPGPGARETAVGRRFHRAICRQHPRSGPRLRERRPFRCPRHQFRRRICRGCRRENPQRELPRPRRQCDRFRETPARRVPWDLGARGFCGGARSSGHPEAAPRLHRMIRTRRHLRSAPTHGRLHLQRGVKRGGRASRGPAVAGSNYHLRNAAVCHEHPERYQNKPERSSDYIHLARRCAVAVRQALSERD